MTLEFTAKNNKTHEVKKVRGANVIDALKDNGLDFCAWEVLSVKAVDEPQYEIIMVIDWHKYRYGIDSDRDRANRIALQVAQERNVFTEVREI